MTDPAEREPARSGPRHEDGFRASYRVRSGLVLAVTAVVIGLLLATALALAGAAAVAIVNNAVGGSGG